MAQPKTELEVSKCFESPTNPRGTMFEKVALDELAASIKQSGVIQPVLARPSKNGTYEVVCGNRRLRAAKQAGLLFIPALIKDLTDEEAREAQIVENLQRADISPIDEAIAYDSFMTSSKPKLDVEGVAAKVGKSVSYIRMRLALLNLDKKYVAKVREGILPVAHAQLIARLDKAEQEEAYKVAVNEWNGTVEPLKDLHEHVRNASFKAAMQSPPWKDDEAAQAEIFRATGIKGGGKTLFGEKAADTFEDPKQYALALAAYLKITQDKYEADGKKLSLVSELYSRSDLGRNVLTIGKYKLVSEVTGCKSGHDALVVEGSKAGKIIRICTDKKCPAHYPPASKPRKSSVSGETEEQRQKRQNAEAVKEAKKNAKIVEAVERIGATLTSEQIDVLFGENSESYDRHRVAKAFGLEPKRTKRSWGIEENYDDAIAAHFGASDARKLQFIFASVLLEIWNDKELAKALKRI